MSGQQLDQDVERCLAAVLSESRSRFATLEQHRGARIVAGEQPHRAVPTEELERVCFLLGLAVRIDHLENGWCSVRQTGADCVARGSSLVGLTELELPLLDAFGNEFRDALEPDAVRQTRVGHRYAFGCRFASDGNLARMFCRCARSSSAVITVSSSGACATTTPHGSAISDRP